MMNEAVKNMIRDTFDSHIELTDKETGHKQITLVDEIYRKNHCTYMFYAETEEELLTNIEVAKKAISARIPRGMNDLSEVMLEKFTDDFDALNIKDAKFKPAAERVISATLSDIVFKSPSKPLTVELRGSISNDRDADGKLIKPTPEEIDLFKKRSMSGFESLLDSAIESEWGVDEG